MQMSHRIIQEINTMLIVSNEKAFMAYIKSAYRHSIGNESYQNPDDGASLTNVRLLNPLNAELNPMCCLLALLAHHFLHISRIRVKSLSLRLLMSYIYIYIYGAPILDVSRSHTTTHHSR